MTIIFQLPTFVIFAATEPLRIYKSRSYQAKKHVDIIRCCTTKSVQLAQITGIKGYLK